MPDNNMTGVPYTARIFAYSSTWKDQLASVTADGVTKSFTYDAIGNLLSDGTRSYTWKNGRQLGTITASGLTASYTYDASGIRTSKTVNGTKTEYMTAGSSILSEKKGSTWQHYLYDGSGQLHAIRYNGADYYYVRDGLMNILGLVDSSGNTVVSYSYDSWGKMLGITGSMANTLGADNPFRHKGYYYDTETGLYYLVDRYYDPEICRFISEDRYVSSGAGFRGYNMYSYCGNDPCNNCDTLGNCFYNARGEWSHDNWEYIGGYQRQEAPAQYVGKTSSGKNMYIGKTDNYSATPNSVKIVDKRGETDPDIQIRDSYKIIDVDEQREILNAINCYNNANLVNPSWDRTINSMIIEWDAHNIAYFVGASRKSSAHVDFNNGDEGKMYWDFVWERGVEPIWKKIKAHLPF